MAASSPRKYVPLAPGHEPTASTRHDSSPEEPATRRAFFAAVVVEEGVDGISEDVQELISAFGTRVVDQSQSGIGKSAGASFADDDTSDSQKGHLTRKRAMTEGTNLRQLVGHKRTLTQTESDALQDMIRELVTTERNYVKRLRILKEDYADPLRNFSKKKDEALLDKYKAKTLFGNIDQLLLVNEAFLNDLEKMAGPNGTKIVGGLGDVCLKHFRDKRAFDSYKLYYAKREEALAIFEDEMSKGNKSGFPAYIERIKYSSADLRNRVGLRELLAEPIQRIPRYTMMWQNIIKEMDDTDPQKAKLMEAEKIASKIASCESDDQTKKATIMYCLGRTVEGFPPGLISQSRKFIDCIDAEDIIGDPNPPTSAGSTSSAGFGTLHCTLFLFDDKLVIVKRPNGTSSGRALARLDDIDKLIRTNTLASVKKSGMTCKGVVDIADVTATDTAGSELHIFLENPPQDQTGRWNGRPFRSFGVVLPPSPMGLDPTATQAVKTRFLNHLWNAQVMYRARHGRSVALRSEDTIVDSRIGRKTIATGFFNIYQRNSYFGEPKKPKVVVHIDESREADAIPFAEVGGPFVNIRLQPLEGELCRYNVTCTDPEEEEEESIVHSEVVPTRIMQTIHQFGLFSFKTGAQSRPGTPTHNSARSRAQIFGLDVISRTLTSSTTRPRSGEFFGFGASASGTVSATKRSKGGVSRSSTQTGSTESTNRFSHRSNSTAGTSLSESDDMTSLKVPRKLLKRSRSPGRISESEHESTSSLSLTTRPYKSENGHSSSSIDKLDDAEKDLIKRLEVAKQNSISHSSDGGHSFMLRDPPFAETIYEEDPPGSRVTPDRRPRLPDVWSPEDALDLDQDPQPPTTTPTTPTKKLTGKPLPSIPRKPLGPRLSAAPPKLIDMPAFDVDVEAALDETIAAFSPPHFNADIDADISDDEPLEPPPEIPGARDISRTPTRSSTTSVEPLSIKKKNSVKPRKSPRRSSGTPRSSAKSPGKSPSSFRRIRVSEPSSPSLRTKDLRRTPSTTRTSPRDRSRKHVERMMVAARTTKEDLSSARRSVKRIKKEVDILRDDVSKDLTASQLERAGALSPTHGLRGMTRSPHMRQMSQTKAAEDRMEEMRQMIMRRSVDSPARFLPPISTSSPSVSSTFDMLRLEKWTKAIESLTEDADRQIALAMDQNETLCKEMASLAIDQESSSKDDDAEKLRMDLQGSKRQTELLKKLLHDATAENEILYSTFNQELEAMYADVQLPEDQAWSAMIEDLKKAKQTRNQLQKDNHHYKRKLQMSEKRNEELLALLRAHGLEPPGQ